MDTWYMSIASWGIIPIRRVAVRWILSHPTKDRCWILKPWQQLMWFFFCCCCWKTGSLKMEQISKEAHSEIGWAVIVWLAHTIIQIRERNLDIGTKRHIGENTVWGGMWTAEWCIIRQEALRTTTISIGWKKSTARSAVSRCPSCRHLRFRLPAPELWEDWFLWL